MGNDVEVRKFVATELQLNMLDWLSVYADELTWNSPFFVEDMALFVRRFKQVGVLPDLNMEMMRNGVLSLVDGRVLVGDDGSLLDTVSRVVSALTVLADREYDKDYSGPRRERSHACPLDAIQEMHRMLEIDELEREL